MHYQADDFFIMLCASRDGSIEFDTANCLGDVARFLDRPKIAACSDKTGISAARTHLLQKLSDVLKRNDIAHNGTVKALWVDDDIKVISRAQDIANDIALADKNGWDLIANYRGVWQDQKYINTLAKPQEGRDSYEFYSDSELLSLHNMDELAWGTVGGLGFAYFRIDLDYAFSFGKYGEDINMWRHLYEDPDFRLRYWAVSLKHGKKFWL